MYQAVDCFCEFYHVCGFVRFLDFVIGGFSFIILNKYALLSLIICIYNFAFFFIVLEMICSSRPTKPKPVCSFVLTDVLLFAHSKAQVLS